jgi:hypothetical protein
MRCFGTFGFSCAAETTRSSGVCLTELVFESDEIAAILACLKAIQGRCTILDAPHSVARPIRPFRGRLYRQLARLFAVENVGGVDAGQTVSVRSMALSLRWSDVPDWGDSSNGSLHGPECSIIPCHWVTQS